MSKSLTKAARKDLYEIIRKELISENLFRVAIYSKAKTKKDLKRIVKENPLDPPIDMNPDGGGPAGTPEEIRVHFGLKEFFVAGPKGNYYAHLKFKGNHWVVK